MTYLLNNKMQILLPPLFLIPNALKLNLTPLLQPRLDIHLQHLVLCRPLSRNLIKRLPLNLHLLMRSLVQLLQCQRQRSLHRRDFRRLRPRSTTRRFRTPTISRSPRSSTARTRPRHLTEDIFESISAAHSALASQKLAEYRLWIAEAESTTTTSTAEVRGVMESAWLSAHITKVEARWHSSASSTSIRVSALSGLRWWWATMKYEIETILIVYLSLLGVLQDLVCLRAFFELFFCCWVVLVLVGMPLQCKLPVLCVSSVIVG
jgi:hypothetical protein